MADCGSEVKEEIEALEAIYIHELEVVKNDRDEATSIVLQLHPATGDEEDKKFVCMTLQLDLPENYPDTLPEVSIRNPRGIGDEEIQSLWEDMQKLAIERKGGPMLYELIELAKESLTVGNIPHCLCMICLEHFYEGEFFTKTDCYHYFHKSCLARYIQHFLLYNEEGETKKLTLYMNQEEKKVQCPVCREEIGYDVDSLTYSPVEDKIIFEPTDEMRQMQDEMSALLEKQRIAGGLIDVDAEKNKFLLKDDDVIHLPAKPTEELKEKPKPSRGGRENDRSSAGRRNKGEDYRHGRKQGDQRHRQEFRQHEEGSRGKSDRSNSGFVRGKGRGRTFEDNRSAGRNKPEGRYKQENRDNKYKRDDQHRTDIEKSNDVDPRAENKLIDEKAVYSREYINDKTDNMHTASEEEKKGLKKPRHDEKINDKLKFSSTRQENTKRTERSPRYSSPREHKSEIISDNHIELSKNLTETKEKENTEAAKQNDKQNGGKGDSDNEKGNVRLDEQEKKLAYGEANDKNNRNKDDKFPSKFQRRDRRYENENRQLPGDRYENYHPRSGKKDDRDYKEGERHRHRKSDWQGNAKSERKPGFESYTDKMNDTIDRGSGNSHSKTANDGRKEKVIEGFERKHESGFRNADYDAKGIKKITNNDDGERKKPRGGFGRPNFERKHAMDEKTNTDTEIVKAESRHSERKGRMYSDNERRNDRYRNNYRTEFRGEAYHGRSRNSDSQNWRDDAKQTKHRPRNMENKVCDIQKDDSAKTSSGTNLAPVHAEENLSFNQNKSDKNCDSESDKRLDRTVNIDKHPGRTDIKDKASKHSHPPGFKIGPPPGFSTESKTTDPVKPPPGF